ncbi:MAG: NAD-dependent epimerase/dehydratase family protein, partial [Promethearchaeota archaeon]
MNEYLNFWQDKKVLITGGAGAIGSNLTQRISELGAKLVIVLDDLSSSYKWNIPDASNVIFVKGSVTDDVVLKRVFQEEPEYVFHLAAFFANQNSVDYPERDINVNGLGTLKVLEYANMCKVERFIYASSGCSIYGSQAPLPLKEEFMSMHLSTPYQITKMLGELYCNFFHHHYGLKVVKTRFFNSYGPREVPGQYRNVIPNFIYWGMKGEVLPITGTGDETRDFTFVGDLIDGLLRAGYFEEAIGEEFNLASGKETRIIDLAKMINDIVGNKAGVKFVSRR